MDYSIGKKKQNYKNILVIKTTECQDYFSGSVVKTWSFVIRSRLPDWCAGSLEPPALVCP